MSSRSGSGRAGCPPFRLLPAAGLFALCAACYTQQPLLTDTPAPMTRVVARLTDSGVVAMSNAIGAGAVAVEGMVTAADATTWELALLRVDYRGGTSMRWQRERVAFPRAALTHATERTLNRRKSWLAGGLIAAGTLLVARLFGAFSGGEPGDGDPVPPN